MVISISSEVEQQNQSEQALRGAAGHLKSRGRFVHAHRTDTGLIKKMIEFCSGLDCCWEAHKIEETIDSFTIAGVRP